MALTLNDCRENLVEKYNISGMQGDNVEFLPVEDGLIKYVIGDVLKTMCKSPSSSLIKNDLVENSGVPVTLQLTKKGEAYLRNNIDAMIKEYNKFNGGVSDEGFIFFSDISSDNKDLTSDNGLASIVNKSDNSPYSFAHVNSFSSSPVYPSGDGVHKRTRDKYVFR